jgi:hypothetical protein
MKTLTILFTFCLVSISSFAVEEPSWLYPYNDWNYYSPGTKMILFRFQSNENNSKVFFSVEQKRSDNTWFSTRTGWKIHCVPGLIPVDEFFELLAQKKFSSST